MSLVVNHNVMAAATARNLNTHYGRLATSTRRLSSGLRINSAADDAAGLAIRELMRADVAALNQGIRNANDAISMIQVVDGALSVIDEKLIRMKELAEQAATGTYNSTQRLMIDSEFQYMASEIQRIATATDFNGIKLIADSGVNKVPKYIKLNSPFIKNIDSIETENERQVVRMHIEEYITSTESKGIQTIEYYIEDDKIYKKTINDVEITITKQHNQLRTGNPSMGVTNEFVAEKAARGFNDWFSASLLNTESFDLIKDIDQQRTPGLWSNPTSYSYTYEPNPENFVVGKPTLNHRYMFNYDVNGDGTDDIQWNVLMDQTVDIEWLKENTHFSDTGIGNFSYPQDVSTQRDTTITIEEIDFEQDSSVKIHFGPMNDSAEDYYYIEKRDCTLKGLGLENIRIESQDNAQKVLVTINDGIVKKDQARAYYGTMQNRLENTITNLSIQSENLQASESRISDVDVATEMTHFVRNQILTQSAVAMLSQANSLPQMAMRLIGG